MQKALATGATLQPLEAGQSSPKPSRLSSHASRASVQKVTAAWRPLQGIPVAGQPSYPAVTTRCRHGNHVTRRGRIVASTSVDAPVAAQAKDAKSVSSVTAPLSFIVRTKNPHVRLGPDSQDMLGVSFAEHEVEIRNLRPLAASGHLNIDRNGFTFLEHPTALDAFVDDKRIEEVYYPEMEELVKKVTGATRVVVFDHTIRKKAPKQGLDGASQPGVSERAPVPYAHVDYTVKSGVQRARDLLGDEGERLLIQGRMAIVQVWRPLNGPVMDAPLAVCDAQTTVAGDLVKYDLIYPDRVGENYGVAFNNAQQWYYAPRMENHEVLVFKCYDSTTTPRFARFTPHSAFEDPNCPAESSLRQSIEIRTLAFWE